MVRASACLVLACALAGGALAQPASARGEEGSERQAAETEREPSEGARGLSVGSRYPVTLYGRINLDASYDSAETSSGNFARWVESEAVAGEDDDEFNVSANATRLGLRIEGPHDVSYVTGATVEADFYGGGSENTPRPRLRHAFFEVTWPETGWDLLVGQSWDVVHPLSPGQLNFVVGWFSGNIGYRRPQVRVSKRIVTGERSAVTVAAAVARTLGDPLFAQDVGADAGVPTGQLRVAVDAPGLAGRTLTFGVSGHVGEQECDDIDRTVRTWSAGVDLSLPLTERVRLEGEAWTGQAVCTYLGGIGQGVNPVLRRAIRATGGWLALKARPAPAWEVNLGWGMDDPWNRDLNDGQRSRNTSFFANAIYRFLESFHVGLELMYMRTEYRNLEGGASLRAMTQARFTF